MFKVQYNKDEHFDLSSVHPNLICCRRTPGIAYVFVHPLNDFYRLIHLKVIQLLRQPTT